MLRKSLVMLIAAVILIGFSVKIYALVPHFMNYQGKLSNGPIPLNGTFTMIFRIYDMPTDGTLLWEEIQEVVVKQGVFNVILGEVNPLNLLFDQDYWLGLQILPDTEMTPRQRMVSVGYSYTAEDSYFLAGHAPGPGNGLDADTVDGAHAADLEESAETEGKIAAHKADAEAHHTKTTSFSELTDMASDAQIPNDITIEHAKTADSATKADDADTVDGKHADEFGDGYSLDAADGDPADVVYVNDAGNVGIGTTNPQKKLEIDLAFATHDDALMRISGIHNPGLEIFSKSNWHPRFRLLTNNGADQWEISAAGSWADKSLVFSYNNSDKIAMTTTGNLGIGTSGPEEKLHISGNMRYDGLLKIYDLNANSHINTYESGSDSPLIYSRYFYGHYGDLIIQASDGYYNTNIHFVTGDPPSQRMVIMENGNVGIGTPNPTSNLHVAGNLKVDKNLKVDGLIHGSINGDADTVDGVHAADLEESAETDSKIAKHKADSGAHHTKTTSFSELTDMASDAQIPNDITIEHATTADSATKAGDADTVDGRHANEFGDGYSLDAADGSPVDAVYVDNTGNVGIGTPIPNAKLSIVGYTQSGPWSRQLRGTTYVSPLFRITGTEMLGKDAGDVEMIANFGFQSHSDTFASLAIRGHRIKGNYGEAGIELGIARDWYGGASEDFKSVMTISADTGWVGIGTTSPGQKLDIGGGNGRVQPGYSWLTDSDYRLKKNITTLENALDKVTHLRGVRYDLKEADDVVEGHGKHIGVIAQELETEYPELVIDDQTTGYKAVSYDKITAILIEAVKELKAENEALKAEISALKAAIQP